MLKRPEKDSGGLLFTISLIVKTEEGRDPVGTCTNYKKKRREKEEFLSGESLDHFLVEAAPWEGKSASGEGIPVPTSGS